MYVLNETAYQFGTYVETRSKQYADLFTAQLADKDQAAQARHRGKAKRPDPAKLKQKRDNVNRHLRDVYCMFAYGEKPARPVGTQRARKNLATAMREKSLLG